MLARAGFAACFLAASLAALPHVIIEHPGEMNAYPTVAFLCLCLGLALKSVTRARLRGVGAAFILFLVMSGFVNHAKWLAMMRYARSADIIVASIDRQTTGPRPKVVCIIGRKDAVPKGYSVFYQSPEWASDWGRAVQPRWGWNVPQRLRDCEPDGRCPAGCDATWEFPGDGRVIVRPGRGD